MRSWRIAKGHGTENDFVIVLDRHGMLNPSADDVRFLCDRRAGVGGDGLLRAIKAEHMPGWSGDPDCWFMDYRNADGSISEMCGNGVRVFARYLVEKGLVNDSTLVIATRAGLKTAHLLDLDNGGNIRVDMGRVIIDPEPSEVAVKGIAYAATAVDQGNPHAVAVVDDVATLDLRDAPGFSGERFPDGVNIEFIQQIAPGHIKMRVHERGVGETRSCGTGTVAAAAVAAQRGFEGPNGRQWRVDVPGGTLFVELAGDQAHLIGPAVIILHGDVQLPD